MAGALIASYGAVMRGLLLLLVVVQLACRGRSPGGTGGTSEGEGELPTEGEGEFPSEGEGESPSEGEGESPSEGEGESPSEGEGEFPSEGEGEPEWGEGEGEACRVRSDCTPRPCQQAFCSFNLCRWIPDDRDLDGDGSRCTSSPPDCAPLIGAVSPNADEVCGNYLDDDCDGTVDELDCEGVSVGVPACAGRDCLCAGRACFETGVADSISDYSDFWVDETATSGWLVAASAGLVRWEGADSSAVRVDVDGRPGEVRALWGSAANDVWAVGRDLLHFDGEAWHVIAVDVWLREIDGEAGNVWAVGDAGHALHLDALGWHVVNVGTEEDLLAVHVRPNGDVDIATGRSLLRGGVNGFVRRFRFAEEAAAVGLTDVAGDAVIVRDRYLFSETTGFTEPTYTDATQVIGFRDALWSTGRYLLVGPGPVDFDGPQPAGPYRLRIVDGQLWLLTSGGRLYRLAGGWFSEQAPAAATATLAISATEAPTGEIVIWALREDDAGRRSLWRRDSLATWSPIDVPFVPTAVVGVGANDVWIFNPTLGGARIRDNAVELRPELLVSEACTTANGGWAIGEQQATFIDENGIRSYPFSGANVVCPGNDDLWSGDGTVIYRLSPDGTRGFVALTSDDFYAPESLGEELRFTMCFNQTCNDVAVTDSLVTAERTERVNFRIGRRDDYWRIEFDRLAHVVNGVEVHTAPWVGLGAAAAVVGDELFLFADGPAIRYSESRGLRVVNEESQPVHDVLLRDENDGFAVDFEGNLVRWDGVAFSVAVYANLRILRQAPAGDLWGLSEGPALTHFSNEGVFLEEIPLTRGAQLEVIDNDDIWIGVPLQHFDGSVFTQHGEGYVLGQIDTGIVTLADGVLAVGGRTVGVTMEQLAGAHVDADGSVVAVAEDRHAIRVAGSTVTVLGFAEARAAFGRQVVAPATDSIVDESRAPRVLGPRTFETAELTFPLELKALQTTAGGTQVLLTTSKNVVTVR